MCGRAHFIWQTTRHTTYLQKVGKLEIGQHVVAMSLRSLRRRTDEVALLWKACGVFASAFPTNGATMKM
jgi:hypothetical protein